MPSAEICRERDWVVDDVIVGTSCTGQTDAWLITAIGESLVCKRTVATLIDGEWIRQDADECLGDLGFRDWTKATPEQLAAIRPRSSPRAPIILAEELNDVRETCVLLLGCKTRREAAELVALLAQRDREQAPAEDRTKPAPGFEVGRDVHGGRWRCGLKSSESWLRGSFDTEAEAVARSWEDRTKPAPGFEVGLPGLRPWTLSDAQGTLRSTCATRAEAVARSWELHDEESRKIAETGCGSI